MSGGSDAELPQMMVDVFVHQDGPLVGREPAEEAVRVRGASGRPGGCKPVDRGAQALTFFGQVAFVYNHQAFHSGGVPAHWLIIAQRQRLDDAADEPADQRSWRLPLTGRQLEGHGTVGHRLGDIHRAPLPGALRSQAGHPLL